MPKILPLIGLTASSSAIHDVDPQAPPLDRDAVLRQYASAVAWGGGQPVILPLLREPLPSGDASEAALSACGPGALHHNAEVYMDRLDGLVLCGGGDVVLNLPRPPEYCTDVDPGRDYWEAALLAAALKLEKPVLGICRGVQLMNVALGGALWGDLPTECPAGLPHRQKMVRTRPSHAVNLLPGSRLAAVCGRTDFMVNSLHHQAVREPAPGLRAAAHSPDGLIEALEHPGHPFFIGVQWHPEALAPRSPEALALFTALAAAAGVS